MFKHLKRFRAIIVTGPQRSGTRICAKMIAHDTGHRYVDEGNIRVDSLNRLWGLWRRQSDFVVQCPALARYVHIFGRSPDTAIVYMIRQVGDIVASQRRIGWNWGAPELIRYDAANETLTLKPDSLDPAMVKYAFWSNTQKGQCVNAFEIRYESLSAHRMWVGKAERKNFRKSQTAVGEAKA